MRVHIQVHALAAFVEDSLVLLGLWDQTQVIKAVSTHLSSEPSHLPL